MGSTDYRNEVIGESAAAEGRRELLIVTVTRACITVNDGAGQYAVAEAQLDCQIVTLQVLQRGAT